MSLAAGAPANWWAEERRAELTDLAARLPPASGTIFLVFDGRHLSEPMREKVLREGREIVQVFAPSADEWIVQALREVPGPIVVTADRALADRARHRGAEVVSTDVFVARCRADS